LQKLIYTVFYDKYFHVIQPLAELNRINPFFILSVAALETGCGKSMPHNNFFGIKASPSQKNKFLTKTKEYNSKDNKFITVADHFRSYKNFSESVLDFCRLIRSRYPQCVGVNDPSVCSLLQNNPKRKYATDPGYSFKLEALYYIFLSVHNENPSTDGMKG
jgi:flagellum-specific peptidoglycan hydrolase FlgJ